MRLALLLLAMALLLISPALAQIGGEYADQEAYVAAHPNDTASRLDLAQAYAAHGFVEDAAAAYLAVLAQGRDDDATAGLQDVLARKMPTWLPDSAAQVAPFPVETLELRFPAAEGRPATRGRALFTPGGFAAHEGERSDRIHGWAFANVAYGYVWEDSRARWELRVRLHSTSAADRTLVRGALQTSLALIVTGRAFLDLDPTRVWQRPLGIWLAEGGTPGAQGSARDLYFYAIATPRDPAEWFREFAHEYGHAVLPGIGGFTKTDDAYADGNLGELLFPKWLATATPEGLVWPVAPAEQAAAATRARLMSRAPKPHPALLGGKDLKARDHLLGLALRVEAQAGPRFLAEVLSRCPRGNAKRFVAEATKLAKARGLTLW